MIKTINFLFCLNVILLPVVTLFIACYNSFEDSLVGCLTFNVLFSSLFLVICGEHRKILVILNYCIQILLMTFIAQIYFPLLYLFVFVSLILFLIYLVSVK